MIVGLGIDLIENRRVERELARGGYREGSIFSGEEIRHCDAGKQPARRYAACFAAKEAVLKALGMGAEDLASFREVEVEFGAGSHYGIVLHDRPRAEAGRLGVRHINVSIATDKTQTGAMVILES